MSKRIPPPMTTNTDVSKMSSTSDSYSNSPAPKPKSTGLPIGTILLFALAGLLGLAALFYKLGMWGQVAQVVFRK